MLNLLLFVSGSNSVVCIFFGYTCIELTVNTGDIVLENVDKKSIGKILLMTILLEKLCQLELKNLSKKNIQEDDLFRYSTHYYIVSLQRTSHSI